MGKWERDLYERVFEFGVRVERLTETLWTRPRANRDALYQVRKSSSSIGSNMEEAKGAASRADFHNKMHIALKEARESYYWLRRIARSTVSKEDLLAPIVQEANEIVAMLTTIVKKTE